VELTALIVISLYVLLIGSALVGWLLTRPSPVAPLRDTNASEEQRFSVIIPARNESQNLPNLFDDLRKQTYSSFDVIVVDDHSSDNTGEIAANSGLADLKVISLEREHGKKAALARGIASAKGDLILTIDADCRVGAGWIQTMVAQHESQGARMSLGPVAIEGKALLGAFQAIDMLVLMLFTCAGVKWRRPMLANGANLMFSKSGFEAVGGYGTSAHVSSGDDVLLMQRFVEQFGGDSIHFVKSRDAIVRTGGQESLVGLLNQRARWLSKRGHMSAFARTLGVFVFLLTLAYMVISVILVAQPDRINSLSGPLVIGCFTTAAVLSATSVLVVAGFFNRLNQLFWLPLVLAFYPLYIVATPIIALFHRPTWKGRPVRS
jgi:cellulose synthase/poly-beta-1,6-N-acetylglucosamine synthase-like glycosyltransferase